jgi:hypothetical protein
MGDKRTNERRRGIIKPGPTHYAINNQIQIDERTRVLKRQCSCKQQQQAFKRVKTSPRKRLEAFGIHVSYH